MRRQAGIEITSIPALRQVHFIRMPKSFCIHFWSQRNAGNNAMLAQAYIVNPP